MLKLVTYVTGLLVSNIWLQIAGFLLRRFTDVKK